MARQVKDILPPPDVAARLEPEELAVYVLECLREEEHQRREPHRHNFTLESHLGDWAGANYKALSRAVMAAWDWLAREGMLAHCPEDLNGNRFFITPRGQRLRSEHDLARYRWGSLLPEGRLHAALAEKVVPLFLRGDYDTAVFQAFKEVEIRVRGAAPLSERRDGVDLMRAAFHETTGPLRDPDLGPAERQAMSHLFAGAYGLFRNPLAHRDVDLDDPMEAAELILLANHLLRIVDRRSRTEQAGE
jgi:uncharacterized protein (TIGR02391 family)